MKVHLSIDDVILSLKDLAEKRPNSVYDIAFFYELKILNEKYGAVFSLYAFENYAERFFINEISMKYWEELVSSGFIRFGFHGTFIESNNDMFFEKCSNFYSVLPKELCTQVLRLHKYKADKECIDFLKKYDISELLCREDESRIRQKFPQSYILSEKEESLLQETLKKDNINFRKTDIRLEFHDKIHLRDRVIEEIKRKENADSEIVIFTHEKNILNKSVSFDMVLKLLLEYRVDYIF